MKRISKIITAAAMLLLISTSVFADPPRRPSADASLSVVEALMSILKETEQ